MFHLLKPFFLLGSFNFDLVGQVLNFCIINFNSSLTLTGSAFLKIIDIVICKQIVDSLGPKRLIYFELHWRVLLSYLNFILINQALQMRKVLLNVKR